jgi:hypothetical protein
LLENIVEKQTIPAAVDLYTDLATEAVQFVCIGETDPAKIADRLEKQAFKPGRMGDTEEDDNLEAWLDAGGLAIKPEPRAAILKKLRTLVENVGDFVDLEQEDIEGIEEFIGTVDGMVVSKKNKLKT